MHRIVRSSRTSFVLNLVRGNVKKAPVSFSTLSTMMKLPQDTLTFTYGCWLPAYGSYCVGASRGSVKWNVLMFFCRTPRSLPSV